MKASNANANEVVIRRFYQELWNEWRLDQAAELVAADVRFRGSLGSEMRGRDQFIRYVETVRAAFPDWHNQIDEILTSGDRVATRMTWTGTHRGVLGKTEPTGAQVRYCGAAFFRLSAGVIEDGWVVGDTQRLWRALGSLDIPAEL
jgi:steroid delta-isomerase-like uncharacterized protein